MGFKSKIGMQVRIYVCRGTLACRCMYICRYSLQSRHRILACQLRWVAVKAKTQRVLARYLMHTICVPCLGMVLLFHMRTQVLRPQLAH